MKRLVLIGLMVFALLPCVAQQVMYGSLSDLLAMRGDTVTTLTVEKRSMNQLYMSSGADFHISAEDNSGLSKYIKNRTYAVQVDSVLYVNCKFIHYNHYHFGKWYARAYRVKGNVYFFAQPYGQRASRSLKSESTTKLGGMVGNVIAASGLVKQRVCYMVNSRTGRAEFVTTEMMRELLAGEPELLTAYKAEESESAEIVEKYLSLLEQRK